VSHTTREHRRLARERRTVHAMILMFCQDHHGTQEQFCIECEELYTYALLRLDHCSFGGNKPTCANCTVHCYKPNMRQKARQVMRYAGPRMLKRHPILAILHLLDGVRKTPGARQKV
jgi:hypothetical protein